jgi:biotin operon repressor
LKIQFELPNVVKASVLLGKEDAFEVFKDIIEQAGSTQINARRVWALLKKHRNKDSAIVQAKMSELLGLNGAVIRASVTALRRMGFYVCSSSRGYYVSKEDIDTTINHLESRAKSEWITAACLKRRKEQDRLIQHNKDRFQKPPRLVNGNLFDAGLGAQL